MVSEMHSEVQVGIVAPPRVRTYSTSSTSSSKVSKEDDEQDVSAIENPPLGLKWRSSTLFIVSVVGVGIFTDLFVYAILVPVLPFVLRDRIGIPDSQLQLTTSVLLGAMAASSFLFSPVAGIIADKVGDRQKPFLVGLIALAGSTVLLAFGNSVAAITVARVLQGMSSAVVWVVGLAICLETVGPSRLGTTIGTIFSLVAFGTQTAPVLGGVLYAKVGYTSVFALCLALIGVDIVLRLLMIEKKRAARYRKHIDIGFSEDSLDDENTPLLSESTAIEDLDAYKIAEPSTWLTQKMPILRMFRDTSFITAIYIGTVQSIILGCYDATIPLVALEYYNFGSLQSGLLFLALGVPGMISGPLAGRAADKFGPRIVAIVGFMYLIPAHILLRIPQPGGSRQIAIFALILAFASIGNSIIDSPSLVESSLVVEKYHKANPQLFGEIGPYAQLYGINSMLFSLGFTVGPIMAGALKDAIGYGNMNAVMAVICASASLLSWMYLGTEPKKGEDIRRVDS